MKTILPKKSSIERKWYLLDAEGQILGKVATKVATFLRGKHKPIFTPHLDVGDGVVIINADKVVLTGNKLDQKTYFSYSHYAGHVKRKVARKVLEEKPTMVLEKAVAGMIPRNKHKDDILKRLKVYAGSEHPHAAQSPTPITL